MDLRPFVLVGAPFAVYLVVHSLHDRVQAHWPAPLYPSIAICAAAGAERVSARWRGLVWAVAPIGAAVGAALLALLLTPGGVFGRYDLALPVRGWAPFAARIDQLRRASGAVWVGTASYGLASELADERGLAAPVVQLAERDRWQGLSKSRPPTATAPGLAIDLTRRLNASDLDRCFAVVSPLGLIARGEPGEGGKTYAVFRVAQPRFDVLQLGCPAP